jgi:Uma2 family endonuclease
VKLRLYGRAAVPHVWLLDPEARLLEVLVLTGSAYLNASAYRDNDVVAAAPFESVSFPLNALWPYDRSEESP